MRMERDTILIPVDVMSKPDGIEIIAELPGIEKNDIDIQVVNSILSITAKKTDHLNEDEKILLQEREYGVLKREIKFYQYLNFDKINAYYKNGLLKIFIPFLKKKKIIINI